MKTYTINELAKALGINTHAIRNWTKLRALPPAARDGNLGVYGEQHLVTGLAIKQMRATGMTLAAIRAHLASSSPEEVAALAGIAPSPTQATQAKPPASTAAPAPAPALGAWRADAAVARELWERVALCPGVVLSVRADADTEARRVASEIISSYASRPSPPRA